MKKFLIAVLLAFPFSIGHAESTAAVEPVRQHFEGTWNTVRNRKLDGRMDCYSVRTGDRWRAIFKGVWHGVKFDYTVDFDGPEDKLVGHPITIDGARYKWTASINDGKFTGTFESPRYDGSFALKEK